MKPALISTPCLDFILDSQVNCLQVIDFWIFFFLLSIYYLFARDKIL